MSAPYGSPGRHSLWRAPRRIRSAQEGHVDVSRLLLQDGADISATDEHGFFPLWVAAGEGRLEVVQILLEGGADLHQTGGGDWTALEVA